jgi:transposase-like protein
VSAVLTKQGVRYLKKTDKKFSFNYCNTRNTEFNLGEFEWPVLFLHSVKGNLTVNNYPVRIYQEGEIEICIDNKSIERHLIDSKDGLKDSFAVYLRECDLRSMLALIDGEK